jgi:hypothetical protein
MSDPLARFQRGWSDMSDPRPGHVQVSEGIDLPIYRPIYRLGRPIFGRFRPVSTRHRRFLGRPTRRRAPRPILGRIRPLFTPPPRFSSAAYPPSRPAQFIGSTVDYRPILVGFGPPLPILVLPDRLWLLSRPEQMENEEYTLLLSWGDRIHIHK